MVQLTLLPPKGNQGARTFPFTGYLGVSPVRVEGGQSPPFYPSFFRAVLNQIQAIRTKVDPVHGKALPSKSLTVSVKCYESRIGRLGTTHCNVLAEYTQIIWSKQDDEEYGVLGDFESSFRILVPAKSPGFSTTTFQEYRIFWRVEASVYTTFTPFVLILTLSKS